MMSTLFVLRRSFCKFADNFHENWRSTDWEHLIGRHVLDISWRLRLSILVYIGCGCKIKKRRDSLILGRLKNRESFAQWHFSDWINPGNRDISEIVFQQIQSQLGIHFCRSAILSFFAEFFSTYRVIHHFCPFPFISSPLSTVIVITMCYVIRLFRKINDSCHLFRKYVWLCKNKMLVLFVGDELLRRVRSAKLHRFSGVTLVGDISTVWELQAFPKKQKKRTLCLGKLDRVHSLNAIRLQMAGIL